MILHEIAEKTRNRIEEQKRKIPIEELKAQAADMDTDTGFPFERALKGKELAFICEVKKASPSKGIIAEAFPYVEIARSYEEAGAAAISVLTEPDFFQGSLAYLREIKKAVGLPVLRKDFIIDPYMIYEAKTAGADAVLLICAILTDQELLEYRKLAESLGMSALVEAHDAEEVSRALRAGSKIIGVNNRDLKTFRVDIGNSLRLRGLVPENIVFVSESGMDCPRDIRRLEENGTDAVLIGELLMKSRDRKKTLQELKGAG